MPSVFFYISGHGFGHAVRQMAIISALGAQRRSIDVDIVVRTSAPRRLFDQFLRVPFGFQHATIDTGVVQIDSVRLDERATIAQAADFYRDLPARVDVEARILSECDARLVISDAPPLACAAAAAANIPCAVVSNFTWDWIYEAYAREMADAPHLLPAIRHAYAQATEGWRLPMYGGFATVPRVVDMPFVARHARSDRTAEEVKRELALPLDTPLVLVSFGGYGVAELQLDRLDCLDDFHVVTTAPAAEIRQLHGPVFSGMITEENIYARGLRYVDLVAAADIVVTKPGYGITSDCIANNTAMLYTSRGRFVEYDVMVRELPRYLRCEFIDLESFLAGRWGQSLRRLMKQPPPPEHPRTDGAEVVADLIASRLSVPSMRGGT